MYNLKQQNTNFSTMPSYSENPKEGIVHIKCSFNNTYISLTDKEGNVKTWASGGSSGFKGSRRSTTFAAQMAAEKIGLRAKELGYHTLNIHIKGLGSGRRSIAKGLTKVGLQVISIKDVTPLPHNGCRPRKRRRG